MDRRPGHGRRYLLPAKALTKELDPSFAFIDAKRDFEIVIDRFGRKRIDPRGMITDRVGFEAFPAAFEAPERPDEGDVEPT